MKRLLGTTVIVIVLVTLTLTIQSRVKAADTLPTVWIRVHRIQAIDPIEGFLQGEADWRYRVYLYDGETTTIEEFKCPSDDNDIVINHVDSFGDLKRKNVDIMIMLYEDDPFGYETADISEVGTAFVCTYNLETNEFVGEETVWEDGHFKTSGDYDGSITVDENDANVWFFIWDNYEAPVANAGADKYHYTGEKVNFDGAASTASSGSSIVKYEWDFENDGVMDSEGEKTSYTYQQKGVHTCRLRVTDSIGEWDEDTVSVTILNRAPVAEFTYSPTDPTIEDVINFVDTSNDPDGTITSWNWIFGDGDSSILQSPSHQYEDKGTYKVKLTVVDDNGEPAVKYKSIKVLNTPPIADFSFAPSDPIETEEIQFTDKSYDLEGRDLTYVWSFGDGYTSEARNPKHSFAAAGQYRVNLTVLDDENWAATKTTVITVHQNLPPTADFSFTPADPTVEKEISFVDLSEDPENKGITCFWDFGDGTNSSAHNPTHKYETPGQYTINLTVWDSGGLSETVTKTVNITPPPFVGTPLFYVLVAVILIGVAFGSAYIFMRKRMKK